MLKLKPLIAAAAVLAVAGSSFVYAQQQFGRDGGPGRPGVEFRHRLSADDVSAFANARIAALKAGLELTTDQEKMWPALETALRNRAQLRVDRIKAREAAQQNPQASPMSPFDRLARRADNMNKASVALKQIADAGSPLYQSLSDAQKARFTILAHMLRPHPMRNWREGRNGDGRWQRWRHDRKFGDNGGPHGGMHRMMDNDGDQDSKL
jgi:hypothetical protein